MFTRAARYMSKVLSYPGDVLSGAAMVAMAFVMLAVSLDVLIRYLAKILGFSPPILGIWDLDYLAFVVIVWGPMAMTALMGRHIAMDFLLEKFPRLPRLGLELIISLTTGGMMGMVSWRLFVHALMLGEQGIRTTLLRLPYAPVGYFAAFACALMALAFLVKVPETVGKIRKEPEAVGKTQEVEAVQRIEKMKGSSA